MVRVSERAIIRLVNEARRRRGSRNLKANAALARAARAHSKAMAEQRFFSHTSPLEGFRTPEDRVIRAAGQCESVGENIAVIPASRASAKQFVDGWLNSKGHKENLLRPNWEVTGVGVASDRVGNVYATQLFGVPSRIVVTGTSAIRVPQSWYVVRVTIAADKPSEIAAFVNNEYTTSVQTAADGHTAVDAVVPATGDRHHVGFGRRPIGSKQGWIGFYDGQLVMCDDGSVRWTDTSRATAGCRILNEELFRARGEHLRVELAGISRQNGLVVVDGDVRHHLARNRRFAVAIDFAPGDLTSTIDMGVPIADGRYSVVRRYLVDPRSGTMTLAL